MLTPTEFWRAVDACDGPGTLGLVLLTSWRTVADRTGMEGADLQSGVFDVVCELAAADTSLRSRVATTVYAMYLAPDRSRSEVDEAVNRWLPMTVQWRNASIRVEAETVWVARDDREGGSGLYERARLGLEAVLVRQAEVERYPHLSISWDEARGG